MFVRLQRRKQHFTQAAVRNLKPRFVSRQRDSFRYAHVHVTSRQVHVHVRFTSSSRSRHVKFTFTSGSRQVHVHVRFTSSSRSRHVTSSSRSRQVHVKFTFTSGSRQVHIKPLTPCSGRPETSRTNFWETQPNFLQNTGVQKVNNF